jgi:hypothetical protein
MKNILFILILLASITGYSQSFESNARFTVVPKYANQAAINTAIPTPTEGMLVYNIALDQYAFYNGTAWTNFPSASSGSSGTAINVPVYADLTAINAIASPAVGWLVYNTELKNFMIRTSTGWTTLSKGWIRIAPNRLSYLNGSVIIGDAASTLPGKLVINRSNATGHHLFMPLTSGTVSVLKFSNSAASIYNNFNYNATAAATSFQWRHQAGTATPTPMMAIMGNGNLALEGFSKFGGTATDVPAIRAKVITGTTSSTSFTNTIAHGITDVNKIIGLNVVLLDGSTYISHNTFILTSNIMNSLHMEGANILFMVSSSSYQNKAYKIYITYTE